jgi:hypothetical protein
MKKQETVTIAKEEYKELVLNYIFASDDLGILNIEE